MSANNGTPTHIGPGLVAFTFDGDRTLTLPLVASVRDKDNLARECQAEGKDRWQFLDAWGRRLAERYNVTLTLDELDALADKLNELFDAKKNGPGPATGPATPTSPPNTESTPSG